LIRTARLPKRSILSPAAFDAPASSIHYFEPTTEYAKVSPVMTKPTFFRSALEFRRWLEENHPRTQELLLGFRRKDSGKPSITYPEALDEALCFGWIDGVRKRFDESSYTVRFTPRKPGSSWSAVNTKRVGELVKLGRVHAAGRKIFDERDRKRSKLYSYERAACKLEGDYENKFRANQKAWEFYLAQAPWYRRTTCWWVVSAKREETRLRRLAQLIEDSAHGRRIKQVITPK
jgi:uncharacterized protein YdeI (YjbR/CyaY-like superfamily)